VFALYLLLLAWIILFKLEVPYVGGEWNRGLKLVPFVRTTESGPSAPLEVLVNLALFVPFGVFLGVLAPRRRWWYRVGLIAATSCALEVAQYVLAVGRTDVTDVIVNTAGGLMGLGVWAVSPAGVRPTLRRGLAVVTVALAVASALYLASPLRFAGPDVPPGSSGTLPERPPRG
jgi:glycopeptide antibiotics resistance protein